MSLCSQVVNLHYMLSKAVVKARPTVLWCYKKDLHLSRWDTEGCISADEPSCASSQRPSPPVALTPQWLDAGTAAEQGQR